MSKALPLIVGTAILFVLAGFNVHQFSNNEETMKMLEMKDVNINNLQDDLQEEEEENAALTLRNDYLQKKVVDLRDSINFLRSEIYILRKKVSKQDDLIASVNEKLIGIEQNYEELKGQVTRLHEIEKVDKLRIQELEQEKTDIRKAMEKLNRVKEEATVVKEKTEAEIMDAEISKDRFEKLTSLVNNTKVRFDKISIRKSRYGKSLAKIKKSNWKYTIINFYLEHTDLKVLLDEKFIVKIVDMDSNDVLSYIETNPNFPNSDIDSKGVQFNFDGNMIELTHHNNQSKEGRNYEAQIYYVNDEGEEYLLMNGVQQILNEKLAVTEY